MTADRIAKLEELMSDMRASLARIEGQLDTALRVEREVDDLRQRQADHETADAAMQAKLEEQIKSLRWSFRAAIGLATAGGGTAIASLVGG